MKVIVHGGHQIGGSCIEVASAETRIILDCGWPLESEPVPPPVPGLFAPGRPPDALLLSHAHPDHTGFVSQSPEDVPIFATAATSKVMKVGSIYASGVEMPRSRFRAVQIPNTSEESVSPFTIGDLQITAYPVDHSCPGAVGYLISHSGRRVFYTGDLRFHGRKPGMRQRIVKDLTGKLDLLITEGTNVGKPQTGTRTEQEVEHEISMLCRRTAGLVMVAYSPQNIDRFVSVYRAAIRARRTFVCDHYQAAILRQLNSSSLPRTPSPNLAVHLPSRRKKVLAYEKHFAGHAIELEEILSAPERYVMLARPTFFDHEFARRIPSASALIFSMWSGYRKHPDWVRAERLVHDSGGFTFDCHSSGHAHNQDLMDFIEILASQTVLPVHTASLNGFVEQLGTKVINSTDEVLHVC